jgi:hypothetical protein
LTALNAPQGKVFQSRFKHTSSQKGSARPY